MATDRPAAWVLYLRKSKGRAGIARQRTITTAHIEHLGGTVAAEFADTDRTAFQRAGGTRPVRERFDDMIAYLRAHPGTGLGAWHADRLTRNDDDTRLLMSVCQAGGHLVETPRGGTYDLSTATGRKRLRDDASNAIYEVDHAIERITAAKLEAVAAGEDLGGRRRFGWAKRADGFAIIPAEAGLITTGTRAVIAGASLASVTRAWNASGVTTTTGNPWTPVEVRRTLRRARNAGLLEHHGKVTGPGTNWEAIISPDDWRACCTILEDPKRRSTPGPSRRWLLSGIAVCGAPGCGTPVIATATHERGRGSRPVYRDRPPGRRGHVARDAAAVDYYVSELAKGWVKKHGRQALIPQAPDVSGLPGQLTALRGELDMLHDAADNDQISTASFVRRSQPVEAKIRSLEQRLAAAKAGGGLPSVMFTDDDIDAGWAGAGLEAQRALVGALMTVTILPSARGRPAGHRPGEPYFRPKLIGIEWKRRGG